MCVDWCDCHLARAAARAAARADEAAERRGVERVRAWKSSERWRHTRDIPRKTREQVTDANKRHDPQDAVRGARWEDERSGRDPRHFELLGPRRFDRDPAAHTSRATAGRDLGRPPLASASGEHARPRRLSQAQRR